MREVVRQLPRSQRARVEEADAGEEEREIPAVGRPGELERNQVEGAGVERVDDPRPARRDVHDADAASRCVCDPAAVRRPVEGPEQVRNEQPLAPVAEQIEPSSQESERLAVGREAQATGSVRVDDAVATAEFKDVDSVRGGVREPSRVRRPGCGSGAGELPRACPVGARKPDMPRGEIRPDARVDEAAPVRRGQRVGVAARGRGEARLGPGERDLPGQRPPRRIGGEDLGGPVPVARVEDAERRRRRPHRGRGDERHDSGTECGRDPHATRTLTHPC
jgi:hypothetical protein